MELRHLRYFLALAEELSFTQAAKRLHTVQSSLSQQIKDLEQEVGMDLVDRKGKKIALTSEGEAFLTYAKLSVENADMAIKSARQVAEKRQSKIRIGFLNVAEIKVMPLIINKLKDTFQDIDIILQSLTCTEQILRLKRLELDLTFTRFRINDSDISSQLILEEKIYAVAHKNFGGNKKPISKQLLASNPFVMCDVNASPIFFEKIENVLHQQSITPTKTLLATNILQHINMVNLGLGWSFLPEYALKFLHEDMKVLPIEFDAGNLNLYANIKKDNNNPAVNFILSSLTAYQLI